MVSPTLVSAGTSFPPRNGVKKMMGRTRIATSEPMRMISPRFACTPTVSRTFSHAPKSGLQT